MLFFSYILKGLFLFSFLIMLGACGSSDTSNEVFNEDTNDENVSTSSLLSSYKIVDTNQIKCFDALGLETSCNGSGQDGAYDFNSPSYTNNGDGTVTDNRTGLTWQQSPDTNKDGSINATDKFSQANAKSYCSNLSLAGFNDWRLPDIKTLYSLMDFSGSDPSGESGDDVSSLTPFIDTNFFAFGYGDTDAGERIIDAQWATTTNYVSTTMNGDATMFGLNLADGRIKGYGLILRGEDKLFYTQCVRGEEQYAKNNFRDNEDLTITDNATNLMWQKEDNGKAINWSSALSYCEDLEFANYDDWKLPNAKELQSIVDYTRSPDTTDSASIDALFNATEIVNEAGNKDFGFYWSSTTHKSSNGMGSSGIYVSFGRSLGYMDGEWMDVHGAGAQRSDPKDISKVDTDALGYVVVDGAYTHGPQGDVIRGYNFARCVRVVD